MLFRSNVIVVFFVCIIFAMLIQGGAYIQIALNVPSAVADVVQGIILFFVIGSEFFLQYKVLPGQRLQRSRKEAA